jgi:hypothetical protein
MKVWKHLTQAKHLEHESSSAYYKNQHSWIECSTPLLQGSCVDAALQEQIRSEAMHWHGVLERLLYITLCLSSRGSAFRGSSDRLFTVQNGNFLGLVELFGTYDDVLNEHLRRVLAKEISDHYCSKRILGELLELLAKRVQETILSSVKNAKYFAIILDCTPDVSHKEQMSFKIRYVELAGPPKVVEHFICF